MNVRENKPELAFSTTTEINEAVWMFLDKSEIDRDFDLESAATLSISWKPSS